MQNAEHHRERFELAYATEWAKAREGNETPERLAAEVKTYREGDTYEAGFPRLRFGWEGYQWALAGRQCLAQIEEPAGAALAAVAGPAWDKTRDSLAMLLLGLARNPNLSLDVACAVLDSATEPGMPLAYLRGTAAAPTPALEAPAAPADEHAAFESIFPIPHWCQRCGDDYVPTEFNAWDAQKHCERWEGWKARAKLAAAPQAPAAPAVDAPAKGEVLVEVSGMTGSGKSAICGEIEIMCRAMGLDVEWPGGDPEKHMTHADWTAALELYKPRVRIVERGHIAAQAKEGGAA